MKEDSKDVDVEMMPNLEFDIEQLGQYFEFIFPVNEFYEWLSYKNVEVEHSLKKNMFANGEFSFTLEGDMKQEIYCGYESFSSPEELRARLIQQKPIKIDLGAIYNHQPK